MKLNLNIPDFEQFTGDQQFVNVVPVPEKIAEFRGQKEDNLFPDGFFEGVAEMLNALRGINFTQEYAWFPDSSYSCQFAKLETAIGHKEINI